ncbi:MAG: DUF4276 family protein, partial [Nitrospirota bacterium]
MDRLLVHVEGQTEETFVNQILAPHLYNFGYSNVSARLIGNARQRNRRGGILPWNSFRSDILNHIKQDPTCLMTTMVDYYGLPKKGHGLWPGRDTADTLTVSQKAASVEAALSADICKEMGSGFDPNRFVPFVTIHEFEGLLFSDCARFGRGIGQPDLAPKFQAIRDQFTTPEEGALKNQGQHVWENMLHGNYLHTVESSRTDDDPHATGERPH